MNDRYYSRYAGKRFASLLVAVGALTGAYLGGDPVSFGSYAQTIGILYGAYLTGQSATDWQKAKNGEVTVE